MGGKNQDGKQAAAPGDPDAASRPRVELDATSGHGRCNLDIFWHTHDPTTLNRQYRE
jgi:peptide methionine sulfoxide reductase MsrA